MTKYNLSRGRINFDLSPAGIITYINSILADPSQELKLEIQDPAETYFWRMVDWVERGRVLGFSRTGIVTERESYSVLNCRGLRREDNSPQIVKTTPIGKLILERGVVEESALDLGRTDYTLQRMGLYVTSPLSLRIGDKPVETPSEFMVRLYHDTGISFGSNPVMPNRTNYVWDSDPEKIPDLSSILPTESFLTRQVVEE